MNFLVSFDGPGFPLSNDTKKFIDMLIFGQNKQINHKIHHYGHNLAKYELIWCFLISFDWADPWLSNDTKITKNRSNSLFIFFVW